MTYKDIYEQEKAEWERKHPNRDYDEYINGLVDQARE